ncbi:hypothetical protein CcrColossus_gp085 [Caulobacter phage CcrColossus]|uniref:Uncharacterized protein n=1 Tax=Caulobacter phage CcrColossus TaxID=1211640 RepID=K4JUE6_9CAUD|nr:hypothetical protein CcrColossus_gp085 [Caulobacter phage CcrColossus]AFU87955.1 hypothetical protein CcrColossus_gp085 [Caulobacter phage CcrColossus]
MRRFPGKSRLYRGMNGDLYFQTDRQIHIYRSTVNKSPLWGVRTGTAKLGVGPGATRFVHRYKWKRRYRGRGRIFALLIRERRINHQAFYPGKFSRF